MLTYVKDFCQKIDFPREAIEMLELSYKQLEEKKESHARFLDLVEYYKGHSKKEDQERIISKLDEIAEETGIHKYTLHMLYAIVLSEYTWTVYRERGILEQIFWDTMYDLKAKLMECYQLYEVWGTSVFWWEIDLFNLKLMAHGRLQFEVIEYQGEYQGEVHTLKNGDKVLNMHIPSGKPLNPQECEESFRRASQFYRDYFVNRPVAFVCTSWLLYSSHREFLPENSNILKFMDFFHIVPSREKVDMRNLWRIFYNDWKKDVKDLPRNSSLQRAYADWLMAGNPVGEGHGVFFLSNESEMM